MYLNLLEFVRDWQLARLGLPEVAYIDNTWDTSPDAPRVLAVKRGASGFYPIDTTLSAAALNQAVGVNQEQAEALHAGSMRAWREGPVTRTRPPVN